LGEMGLGEMGLGEMGGHRRTYRLATIMVRNGFEKL